MLNSLPSSEPESRALHTMKDQSSTKRNVRSVPSKAMLAPEHPFVRIMSVMKDAFGTVPKELWGLCHTTDLLAARGFVINDDVSFSVYCAHQGKEHVSYPIVRLKTSYGFNKPITILEGVRSAAFGCRFNSVVTIRSTVLAELAFDKYGDFNQPLDLPKTLKKLNLGSAYDQSLVLPAGLQRLSLAATSIYNQPIVLSSGIIEAKFGCKFNQSITLPSSLRRISFGTCFKQEVTLPRGLEIITFNGEYAFPLVLPESVKFITLSASYKFHLNMPPGCVRMYN